jgi:hypothetical protein
MSYCDDNYKQLRNYIDYHHLPYEIISNDDGHCGTGGSVFGKVNINPYHNVVDIESAEEFIMMNLSNSTEYVIIDVASIESIKNKNCSWYLHQNGYAGAMIQGTHLYMHQFLMGLWGQGKGTISIDHINRNKLDNRLCNLRYSDQSLQNSNRDKLQRKYNAQELPSGITHSMLPKYVYYCSEIMNKNTPSEYVRDYFRIEKHPKLAKKCISSSKSTRVNIMDKLIEIKSKLYNLDHDIVEEETIFPKYIRLKKSKTDESSGQLIYERRVPEGRQSLKQTIRINQEDMPRLIEQFCEKVKQKYGFEPST